MTSFPSDIEIASKVKAEPVVSIAAKLGLTESDIDLYGSDKAKVHLDALKKREKGQGKLILVSAITEV